MDTITLDTATVRQALCAVKAQMRSIKHDSNSYRREVQIANALPQLEATAAKLEAALEMAAV